MPMTRREILLSACALAGTPARLSAAQSRDGIQQSTLASEAPAAAVDRCSMNIRRFPGNDKLQMNDEQ